VRIHQRLAFPSKTDGESEEMMGSRASEGEFMTLDRVMYKGGKDSSWGSDKGGSVAEGGSSSTGARVLSSEGAL